MCFIAGAWVIDIAIGKRIVATCFTHSLQFLVPLTSLTYLTLTPYSSPSTPVCRVRRTFLCWSLLRTMAPSKPGAPPPGTPIHPLHRACSLSPTPRVGHSTPCDFLFLCLCVVCKFTDLSTSHEKFLILDAIYSYFSCTSNVVCLFLQPCYPGSPRRASTWM